MSVIGTRFLHGHWAIALQLDNLHEFSSPSLQGDKIVCNDLFHEWVQRGKTALLTSKNPPHSWFGPRRVMIIWLDLSYRTNCSG